MEDCVLLFIQYLTFSVTSALNYEIGGNVLCPVPSPMEYFQVKSGEHSVRRCGPSGIYCVSLTQTWVKARYRLVTHSHLDAV